VYLDQHVVLLDSAGSWPRDEGPGEHPGVGDGARVSDKLAVVPADRVCSATTTAPQ
jgi:hypothetical protein